MALKFFLSDEAQASGIKFESPREGDAGFDIRSLYSYTIEPGQQIIAATGLHLAIPEGWVGLVRDRSSMAARRIAIHGGVIDASYRGEVMVLLSNSGTEPFPILSGDRIAQLVVVPYLAESSVVESRDALGITGRGAAGFGSSGR